MDWVCRTSLSMRHTVKECRLCETSLLLLRLEKADCITHDVDNQPSLELT